MIPFLPWEPDKGPFSASSIDVCSNLVPNIASWGPIRDLEPISEALGADAKGAWYIRRADGTVVVFAGTATALKRLNGTTGAFDDVSGSSAPYNVQEGELWQGLLWGTQFIVTNSEDPVQKFEIETGSTFEDLGGNPPQAKYIWPAGDFVVLGNLKEGADEFPTDFIHSAVNDAEGWTIGEDGCDRQTLPFGEDIVGGIPFVGGARIFQRKAKQALYFTGGQFIFEVRAIDMVQGSIAPYSIVPIGTDDYVLYTDAGFFRGDANAPIGEARVNNYVRNLIDSGKIGEMQGVANPYEKTVTWVYTDQGANRRCIGYDWVLDRWFQPDIAPVLLASIVTSGKSPDDATGSPDDPGFPGFDSPFWKGGRPVPAIFAEDGILYSLTGDPAAGLIETQTTELIEDRFSMPTGLFVKGNLADFTVEHGTTILPDSSLSWGSAVSRNRFGLCPLRKSAKYHRFRVNANAGGSWKHLHGVSIPGECLTDGGAA